MRRVLQTRSGSRHACTTIVEPEIAIGQLMDVDAFDLSSSDSLDNVTPAANFDIYDGNDDDAVAEPRHNDVDDDDDDNNDAAVAEPRNEFQIYDDDDMDAPLPLPQDLDQFDLDMGVDAGEEPAPHEAQLEALGGASDGEAGLREAWNKMSSSAHGELLRSALSSLSSNYVLQRGGV
jgi:hypothetical protein